jgi:S1-C subfamily serine protease
LLELNGIALRSADDLRRALAERPADADVKLVLIDRRGERRECVWKPSAER